MAPRNNVADSEESVVVIFSFSAKNFDESDGLSLKDDVSLPAITSGPHV